MNTIQPPQSDTESTAIPGTPVHSTNASERLEIARITALLSWFKHVFDYLGGSREKPPAGMPFLVSPLWLGIWWGLMIGLILLFCGQTSKFIYIDF
ncbi:MAG TPA: hypothetical protein VH597_01100 [Verrucomicrobiae bacterium]|jgi:hypothetical protein|nr:hypothetical protein [Verrucomicrobiae bacterium]